MKKSNLIKRFLAFIIAMIAYSFVQGQSIKGKVIDDLNNPLSDVYLINQNTGIHSHTNELGIFYLVETNIGDTVLVSHIGFTNQIVVISKINLETYFNIQLKKTPVELEQVLITPDINSLNQLSIVDLQTNPVNSSQEILRKVPGLIIGQHAGGGKAEQMFLRGFDIDHGTDVNITVDGLPVNMVSHAHGQGYADLHFLIPEIINNIDYGKGPYYADKGNFTTAGYVAFHTKDRINKSLVSIDFGSFNTLRTLALFDLLDKSSNADAYIAGEYTLTDGAFQSPQHFNRLNLFSKYSASISSDQKITLQASYFQSKWDASGQIPQRAVDANLINRFGAIDDTEGGTTSRTNLSLSHFKYINDKTSVKNRMYYTKYDFKLYSNFTFYLNDPINGDQIKQKETRNIIGIESIVNRNIELNRFDFDLQAGVGFKYDDINSSELSSTIDRKTTLDTISFGDIDESNMYGFISSEFNFGNWLIKPAIRFDFFKFDYINQLANTYSTLTNDKIIASPKLNIIYSPKPTWQLYLKSGIGFHSNDSRIVVTQNGGSILPLAYGADFGTIWKPSNRLVINTTLWYLFLEQEFVYVGDEGIVEPSGKTRRIGIDFGFRYQLLKWLFLNADINYANARSIDDPEGENFIPLAPDFSSTSGFSFQHPTGIAGGIYFRYIDDRPANEDNSIIAKGYFITDMNLNYGYKDWNAALIIENIFNNDWNETQFATESRLLNEINSIEEIHFIPGNPFTVKGRITIKF